MEEIESLGFSEYEMTLYCKQKEWERQYNSRIRDAEIFAELKKAVEVAVRLIELGVKDEIISEATDIGLQRVKSISASIKNNIRN